jgi:hypothetical protein
MAGILHPARAGRGRAAAAFGVLALTSALAGCASGDFGRTRADMRSDDMHRWVGEEATASIGIAPSQFQLTDDERQLRDYAYPLIEPPHSRPEWKGVFGDYTPLSAPWRREVIFDRTAYGRLLIDEPHRSHASRYAQLMEDVRDDLTRIEPFFAVATRVLDMDSKRNQARTIVSGLSPREDADATARMAENALVIKWVQHCLKQRVSSYRWALERLVLQAPDPMVAEADRLIALLETQAMPRVAGAGGGIVVSKG